jgi:hypothetical protein
MEVDSVIHYGGGGAPTTLVNGSFGMNAFEAPLISAILPRYLHLRLDQNRSHAFQSVLDLLAAETAQPGIASSRLIMSLRIAICLCHSSLRKQLRGSAERVVGGDVRQASRQSYTGNACGF